MFIAVGTSSRPGDGYADLSYVHSAAEEIASADQGFTVVVDKSTVPVGTGDEVERIIRAANPDADFAVVSNPEFLRGGAAIEDFKRPDQIVIGSEDERALQLMRDRSTRTAYKRTGQSIGRAAVVEVLAEGSPLPSAIHPSQDLNVPALAPRPRPGRATASCSGSAYLRALSDNPGEKGGTAWTVALVRSCQLVRRYA